MAGCQGDVGHGGQGAVQNAVFDSQLEKARR